MIDQYTHDAESWYVVHCQPFKERLVGSLLSDHLGLMVYLPAIKRRRHGRTTYAPFFPRYLFVRAHLSSHEGGRINTIAGVLGLVTFGDVTPQLSEPTIDAIRERVDALNLAAGQPNRFRPGDRVLLTEGPLAGLSAVFTGPMRSSERVRVLIEFLGRQRTAEVSADGLRRIDGAPPVEPHPPRRTRGRGRAIHSR
jgi:transcriptional antiterminator RfaH